MLGGMDNPEAPRGLRPNYSCGSLAAAEQLEALMHQPRGGGMQADGMDLAQRQQQLYAAGAALGGMYPGGDGGSAASGGMGAGGPGGPHGGCEPHVAGAAAGGHYGAADPTGSGGGGGMLDPAYAGGGLQQMMPRIEQGLYGGQGGLGRMPPQGFVGGDGGGMLQHPLGGLFGGGGGDERGASSLSMLHYASQGGMPGGQMGQMGLGAMGGNGAGSMIGSCSVGNGQDEASMQKRRFVWTADLHSRFEAAVNALGLDNAKPKSILKLMNVDGLTKANIKSHLQKYRCLMQKKAQAARANGQPPPQPGGGGGGGMGSLLQASASAGGMPGMNPGSSMGGGGMGGGGMGGGGGGGIPSLPTFDTLGGLGASASNPSSVASTVHADGNLEALTGAVAGGVGAGASIIGADGLSRGGLGLPDSTLISQGESSLQRNLEVQEMTLKVQMELQEELSRQLQLQKKLQSEMETLMNTHVEVRDESTATNSKMGSILALKRKLQHELQAHLRMQHQLLSQLNQVVLPAVERLHTEAGAPGAAGSNGSGPMQGLLGQQPMQGAIKVDGASGIGQVQWPGAYASNAMAQHMAGFMAGQGLINKGAGGDMGEMLGGEEDGEEDDAEDDDDDEAETPGSAGKRQRK